jgi:hypothetical protein
MVWPSPIFNRDLTVLRDSLSSTDWTLGIADPGQSERMCRVKVDGSVTQYKQTYSLDKRRSNTTLSVETAVWLLIVCILICMEINRYLFHFKYLFRSTSLLSFLYIIWYSTNCQYSLFCGNSYLHTIIKKWYFWRRTADVRSVGYSELFVLSREDVLEALKDHPDAEVKTLIFFCLSLYVAFQRNGVL